MTDGLRRSHLRKAHQVGLSEVGLPEGNRLSPFTRVEKTHLFQKDPPIWSLLSVVKCFALQYLWFVTYFHVRTGCAPTRFLNAKSPDVTFKKSRELVLPFFLEEETHLMHMKCCASASFLNYNFATCTIDSTHIFLCKHSISISRKVVNHAIANAVIWVEFAIVGHAWSITTKQYYRVSQKKSTFRMLQSVLGTKTAERTHVRILRFLSLWLLRAYDPRTLCSILKVRFFWDTLYECCSVLSWS